MRADFESAKVSEPIDPDRDQLAPHLIADVLLDGIDGRLPACPEARPSAITSKPATCDRLKAGHFVSLLGRGVPYFELESFGKLAAC